MENKASFTHEPVMLQEVLQFLAPKAGEVIVDCTFGAGGYSKNILAAADCTLLAIDRDKSATIYADPLTERYPERFKFYHADFAQIRNVIQHSGAQKVNGIVFDLGVSSMQIDDGERGFSFMHDGPLDMRMDNSCGMTAADIVNTYGEKDLANILYHFGDERKSFQIARMIISERTLEPITTTARLAAIIRRAVGYYNDKIDPATRSFQALRIAVNEELKQLETALKEAAQLLEKGGRLVVVTFHSGEDKIVKHFFKQICGKTANINRHLPLFPSQDSCENNRVSNDFIELQKGVITATKEEVERNARARSAKLRAIVKL